MKLNKEIKKEIAKNFVVKVYRNKAKKNNQTNKTNGNSVL